MSGFPSIANRTADIDGDPVRAIPRFMHRSKEQLFNHLVGLGKQRPARYRCIQMCRNGMLGAPTFATQNGAAVNLTTETGESYRAWPDWNAPYSRIRIDARGEHTLKSGGAGSEGMSKSKVRPFLACLVCRKLFARKLGDHQSAPSSFCAFVYDVAIVRR
jgi:hypothetical protein